MWWWMIAICMMSISRSSFGIDTSEISQDFISNLSREGDRDRIHDNQISYDCDRGTLLHFLAAHGTCEMVSTLLPKMDTVNLQSRVSKSTALHVALKNQRPDIALLILKQGGVVAELKDKDGNTVLHFATEHGYLKIIQFLLHDDVSVREENGLGLTSMDIAEKALDGEEKGSPLYQTRLQVVHRLRQFY